MALNTRTAFTQNQSYRLWLGAADQCKYMAISLTIHCTFGYISIQLHSLKYGNIYRSSSFHFSKENRFTVYVSYELPNICHLISCISYISMSNSIHYRCDENTYNSVVPDPWAPNFQFVFFRGILLPTIFNISFETGFMWNLKDLSFQNY